MNIVIRKAVADDYNAIADISRNDLGYDCSDEMVKARLKNIDDSREIVFSACINDSVVGFIHAEKYEPLYFEPMVNLLGLAVSVTYRKNGVGRLLLAECEKWAEFGGAKYIRVNSGASRVEAHSFYRNLGYDNEKIQIRFLKGL